MIGTDYMDLIRRLLGLAQHDHTDVSVAEEAAEVIQELQCRDIGLLSLLYDIRKAAGDPEGKLMQDELVARIAALKAASDAASIAHINIKKAIYNKRFVANSRRRLLPIVRDLEQALGKGEKP